eukprot:TRINITY_DN3260_c0_g1_i2.p1 TRINITY_DN3260_c0_g1~~TRINITY_DN3260_c0_g1_i2.p1  ORF type:complete len:271 (+),score=54.68 TRINITY_DN3260_c0_g1_i2:389-1201(+)
MRMLRLRMLRRRHLSCLIWILDVFLDIKLDYGYGVFNIVLCQVEDKDHTNINGTLFESWQSNYKNGDIKYHLYRIPREDEPEIEQKLQLGPDMESFAIQNEEQFPKLVITPKKNPNLDFLSLIEKQVKRKQSVAVLTEIESEPEIIFRKSKSKDFFKSKKQKKKEKLKKSKRSKTEIKSKTKDSDLDQSSQETSSTYEEIQLPKPREWVYARRTKSDRNLSRKPFLDSNKRTTHRQFSHSVTEISDPEHIDNKNIELEIILEETTPQTSP